MHKLDKEEHLAILDGRDQNRVCILADSTETAWWLDHDC